MTRTFTLFCFLAALILSSIRLKAQESPIYQANFKVNQPDWLEASDANTAEKVVNGRFLLTHKKNKASYKTVEINPPDEDRGYRIETVITHIAGGEDTFGGVAFEGDGDDNNYFFVISAAGSYSFSCRDGGYFKPIINPTHSSAIKKGGSPNKLAVEIANEQFTLFINGVQVARLNDRQAFGNDIGFIAEKEQTSAFDYLMVTYLPAQNENTPQSAAIVQPQSIIRTDVKPVPTVLPVNLQTAVISTGTDSVKRMANTTPGVSIAQIPVVKDSGNNLSKLIKAAPVKPVISTLNESGYITDFSKDDENQWGNRKPDSAVLSLDDQGYHLVQTTKSGFTSILSLIISATDARLRNFILETEITHDSGNQKYGYGLAFGADKTRQYYFCITDSGYYYITEYYDQSFHTVVAFTPCDAIHIGDKIKNKLTIRHADGQLYFLINDQQVNTHVDFPAFGGQFGLIVTYKQGVTFNSLTFHYTDKNAAKSKIDNGPTIAIYSPEVSLRGLHIVQNNEVLHVVGRATSPFGIFKVQVNEIIANTDEKTGDFTADIPMAIGENPLRVEAWDDSQKTTTKDFKILRNYISDEMRDSVRKAAGKGKYYALIIGVNEYKDDDIASLEHPISDGEKLGAALEKNYTFDKENVITLKNPTRNDLTEKLDSLVHIIKETDNLLIFYAGHGNYDQDRQQGYWLPSDANLKKRINWISNTDITDEIKAIKSKHTLLIADACFAGSIFKSRGIEQAPKNIQDEYNLTSRKAMSSGGMAEVPDDSKFMTCLIKKLIENTDAFLPADVLFQNFKAAVINYDDQVPIYGDIKNTGDEGGQFVFIKRP